MARLARLTGARRGRWPGTALAACALVGVAVGAAACGNSAAVAPAPIGHEAWVATGSYQSEPGYNVIAVNLHAHTRGLRVITGSEPAGLASADGGRMLVVANRGSDTLRLVDTTTGALVDSIQVGEEPDAVAVAPAAAGHPEEALVANFGSNSLTPVNLTTRRAGKPIPVGDEPTAVAVAADGPGGAEEALVANFGSSTVTPVDLATMTPGPPILVGSEPVAVAVVPGGHAGGPATTTALVANFGSSTVTPIAVSSLAPGSSVNLPVAPTGMAVAPDDATVWLTGGAGLYPVTTTTLAVGFPVTLGSVTEAVAITGDGKTAWVAEQDGWLVPVTLPTGPVGRGVYVGGRPSAVVIPTASG